MFLCSDNMEMDQVTMCLEDKLRTEGILSSDNDLTSNKIQLSKLLKGVNLEDNMPQKQVSIFIFIYFHLSFFFF